MQITTTNLLQNGSRYFEMHKETHIHRTKLITPYVLPILSITLCGALYAVA
jgi:hypothetical protein